MSVPGFTKRIVGELENEVGSSQMNTFFTVGDINRDGRVDLADPDCQNGGNAE